MNNISMRKLIEDTESIRRSVSNDLRTAKSVVETLNMANWRPEMERISRDLADMYSPLREIVEETNRSLSGFHDSTDIFKRLTATGQELQETVQHFQYSVRPLRAADLALHSQFTHIVEMSRIAELRLPRLEWEGIGGSLTSAHERVLERFSSFTESYATLLKSVKPPFLGIKKLPPLEIEKLPPLALKWAPFEFFRGVELVDSVLDVEPEEGFEEPDLVRELTEETEQSLEELIRELDPELILLWRGAKEALRLRRADYVRHVSVSLRELFTHVLHRVAPDEEVQNWTDDPTHYHNERPTRRARLLYIHRDIDHPPFEDFILKDVNAALAFVGLFQGTTHSPVCRVTDTQLEVMVLRMEGLLRFLLEVRRGVQ